MLKRRPEVFNSGGAASISGSDHSVFMDSAVSRPSPTRAAPASPAAATPSDSTTAAISSMAGAPASTPTTTVLYSGTRAVIHQLRRGQPDLRWRDRHRLRATFDTDGPFLLTNEAGADIVEVVLPASASSAAARDQHQRRQHDHWRGPMPCSSTPVSSATSCSDHASISGALGSGAGVSTTTAAPLISNQGGGAKLVGYDGRPASTLSVAAYIRHRQHRRGRVRSAAQPTRHSSIDAGATRQRHQRGWRDDQQRWRHPMAASPLDRWKGQRHQ